MREADDDYVPEKKSGGNTAVIIVLVIGGIFLAVVLVCGGLGFYAFRSFSQVMQTAMAQVGEMVAAQQEPELFFNDLQAGQIDAAYARTSKAYKARTTLDDFKKFLDAHKALKNYTSRAVFNQNPAMGVRQVTLQYTLTGADGKPLTVTVQVVKEDDQWRIDSLTIPEKEAAPKP